MNNTEQLEKALKLLSEADSDRGAPPFLETRLRAAFREHHKARRRAFSFRWAAVAGMLACAAFVMWRLASPAAVQAPKSIATVTPAPGIVTPSEPKAQAVKPEPPVVARRRAAAPVTAAKARASRPADAETGVQEFIALPYAPPLTSWDRGQVVRVRLPRESLRSFGIPVNEERMFERVPADLLMGEDGLARAIRFVSASEQR